MLEMETIWPPTVSELFIFIPLSLPLIPFPFERRSSTGADYVTILRFFSFSLTNDFRFIYIPFIYRQYD